MPLWVILLLVATGIGVGFAEPGRFSYAFGTATLYVFLPPLLFEAAWNLNARMLLAWWRPIFVLAFPGVLVTTAVVGCALALSGVPWPGAFLIGSVVSATDPIAIVAIFRRTKVPEGLSTIVQSEALLNDATAVVVYRVVLLVIASGFALQSAALIVTVALAGVAVGIALGIVIAVLAAMLVLRQHGPILQSAATLSGAYVVYFLADALHGSSIFAVIAFGITLRAVEHRFITVKVADDVAHFWDVLALIANALVFLLTGAALDLGHLTRAPLAASAALVGIVLARLILAYGLTPLALGRKTDARWLRVVRVAGARGALSLALALAIPASLVYRPMVVDVTFTVVLATLLGSAFTVPRAVSAAAVLEEPFRG